MTAPIDAVNGLVEGLRAGLDGVTPGPWTLIPMRAIEDEDDEEGEVIGYSPASIEGGDGNPVCLFADPGGSGTLFENAADHAHILRCSPDNIAKLLTALESLSRDLADARAAILAEREACARLADAYDQGPGDGSVMGPVMAGQVAIAQSIAASIRARSVLPQKEAASDV